jgi:hypothetical protein
MINQTRQYHLGCGEKLRANYPVQTERKSMTHADFIRLCGRKDKQWDKRRP